MLNEYLTRLKNALHNDIEERDEILNFVEEMINDRMENGESLEDILASLGEPEKVAESFTGTPAERPKQETQKDTLRHFEYRNIRKIDIESISFSYEFFPSDDDRFLLDIEAEGDPGITVDCHNGVLKIEQDPIEGDFRDMFRNWSISRNLFNREVLVKLALPQDSRCSLEIDNVSGSLSLRDIALEKAEIDSVSGPLTLNNICLHTLNSEMVSGSLSLQNVTVEEKTTAEMVSGSLRTSALKCPKISLEAVSGSIDLQIDGRKEDYEIRIEKPFREEHIPGNGNCLLKIEGVSGRIRYGFTE
ncbi:MAG: DUF4097 family beta strand repeat protein [Erysipelotrichaceae bacterium]|nr:DUF4097 family beta strand repeat protein [Erysipelotrichaceae bacterium]